MRVLEVVRLEQDGRRLVLDMRAAPPTTSRIWLTNS
jgi:hypothetical protein